jgi:murein DD-endopeptidase MepM/ murein hydrolase activator NlpD
MEFGSPVYAAADGKVLVAGSDAETPVSPWQNFYGNVVVLEHELAGLDEPVFTLYAHLSEVEVSAGDSVAGGDKIGEVGASGVALGSHLHLEVRVGANDYASTRNPELWLAPLQLSQNSSSVSGNGGVLAVRVVEPDGRLVPTVLSVEHFQDPNGPVTGVYPVEPYQTREKYPVNRDDVLGENFLLGDLPPGRYKVSFIYFGALYQRWIDVVPGKLTYVPFNVP